MKKYKIWHIILYFCLLFKCFSKENFGYRITQEKDVYLFVQENVYFVQPQFIISSGNMLYFAAQDFTKNKELFAKGTKEVDIVKDEDKRKIIKTIYYLGDDKKIYDEYELILFLEIRDKFPFLAIYSKFLYKGEGVSECCINWGLDSAYEPYKYYTIPKKDKIETYKLEKSKNTKIGVTKWIFLNTGEGEGSGLIAPSVLLAKRENFIFINTIPPKKKIAKGESIDVFMIFLPIEKNFKILGELYEKIKNIEWVY